MPSRFIRSGRRPFATSWIFQTSFGPRLTSSPLSKTTGPPNPSLQRLFEHRAAGERFRIVLGKTAQHADAPHALALLRARRERPCRRAAEQRDELAAPHSITSSARASSVGGTVRRIA